MTSEPYPISGMIMPGGWHFLVGDVPLAASTLEDLYEVVRAFRIENSLPLGDVPKEVNAQICGRFPRQCQQVTGYVESVTYLQAPLSNPSPTDKLIEDATKWAVVLLRREEKFELVTDNRARERAQICDACPMNASLRGSCSLCVSTLERNAALLRQGRELQVTKKLGGCRVLKHHNPTAVFLDDSILGKSDQLPSECWLR